MNKEFEDEIWESFLKAAVNENSQNEIRDFPSEQEMNYPAASCGVSKVATSTYNPICYTRA